MFLDRDVACLAGMHSRRGVVRLASAGMVASILAGRLHASVLAQTPFPTRIRVLHAAPELGKVEVLFNNNELLDEFDYGMTSDWLEVKPGTVRITIRRDRAGFNYVVFDAIAPVVANEDYELIISAPMIIPVPVDRSPLPEGHSRVQVIQASPEMPALDIAKKGGDVIIDNLGYGQVSDALVVAAASYDLDVRLHGTGEVLVSVPQVQVAPNMIYDVVIYGTPGSEPAPLTTAVLTDTPHPPVPGATPAATPTA